MKNLLAVLSIATIFFPGCGRAGTDAKSVGKAIGENVTDFASGVAKGVDSKLEVTVEFQPSATDRGLSHTVASQGLSEAVDTGKPVSVYVLSRDALTGVLSAKALNSDGKEIGRARTEVTFSKDDAQYVTFAFPPEMDRTAVVRYQIEYADSTTDTK